MKRRPDIDFAAAQAEYEADLRAIDAIRDRQVKEVAELAAMPYRGKESQGGAYPACPQLMYLDSSGDLRYNFYFDGKWLSESVRGSPDC